MKRKIIKIDEAKCTGCGECVPGCPEGAIQVIDGKLRLISDRFCDGLGACLKECPEGAISIEEREAEPYDETKVMESIVRQGPNVILAHLKHLREHGETAALREAEAFLAQNNIKLPTSESVAKPACGCPGAESRQLRSPGPKPATLGSEASQLTHWPIQLHLLSPMNPAYQGAQVLLSADCVPFAAASFHSRFLAGKALAIACPKLDSGHQSYLDKLTALIDEAGIVSLSVLVMQVPCCSGLVRLAVEAATRATRKISVVATVISLQGEVLSESPVFPG